MLPPERIHLSEKAKQQLIQLRRRTGIDRWNVLCRWAFCLSLSEDSKPQDIDIKTDSNIEMTWRTFAGAGYENLYYALLKNRCFRDGLTIDETTLTKYLRLHIHRGIGYLAGSNKIRRLEDFQNLLKDKIKMESTSEAD